MNTVLPDILIAMNLFLFSLLSLSCSFPLPLPFPYLLLVTTNFLAGKCVKAMVVHAQRH